MILLFFWHQQPWTAGRGGPLTVSFREYIQYQRVCEPVYNPDVVVPEIRFPDRWYSPFSQHVKLHENISRRARAYTYPFTMEPPFETTSPPEPMPDAMLSTQLVHYPLPNHMPEGMAAY